MSLVDRIKQLSEEKGLNIKQLEVSLGFANGSIRRWDQSSPSADKLYKIANFLNTTCEYLLTGKKESTSISSEDIDWLRLIHSLPADVRLEIKGEMKGYLKYMGKSVAADNSRTGTDNLGK